MLASYRWLRELCDFDESPEVVRTRLTAAGLEVESVKEYGVLPGVVIAEVRGRKPHPNRDKLSLVTLFDGEREHEVVCGAPNVPAAGKRVLFARLGAKLPNGLEISERKLGGVVSAGMICSEVELDVGAEGDGIFIVDDDCTAAPGTLVSEGLGLRDTVFEIGLTPNRPDCLGHVGLARELSALLGRPLRLPRSYHPSHVLRAPAPREGEKPLALHFSEAKVEARSAPAIALRVTDSERCPRYAACAVEDVRVGPSPFWLRYRLHVLGLRPLLNAIDITNLVLLEYGYPTHAFDAELLRGGRIEVRAAREGESIVTLDGVARPLSTDDLLICDAEGGVAIAGVMGGERSGIRNETRRVIVECAYFDPRSVRRTSRRLGLHTDSSHRFERGVDPRAVPGVLSRVVSLLAELAGGVPAELALEVYPVPVTPKEIALRLPRVDALLGATVPDAVPQAVLEALGCEVEVRGGDLLRVRAPTWRPDLTREEDLIEEVARVWGYDKIPSLDPLVRARAEDANPATRFVRQLKQRAAAVGLTEAINLAFVAPGDLARAQVPTEAVRLVNPLSEERSVMRTSLLPGLLANVQRAQRQRVAQVMMFELSRVFAPATADLPDERMRFALVLAGARPAWIGAGPAFDFFDAKGLLEEIVRPLTRLGIETRAGDLSNRLFLHPRKSALVRVGEGEVGFVGELHPDVSEAYELEGSVVYAELDVALLLAQSRADLPPQVRLLPRFPASSRDLALEVVEDTPAAAVTALLTQAGGELVEAVELFDLYQGAQVARGKKSLAFRIVYRDREATLTDERVDKVHAKVLTEVQQRLGAEVRK